MSKTNLTSTFNGLAMLPKNKYFNPESETFDEFPTTSNIQVGLVFPDRIDEWKTRRYDRKFLSESMERLNRELGISYEFMFLNGMGITLRVGLLTEIAKAVIDADSCDFLLKMAVLKFYGRLDAVDTATKSHKEKARIDAEKRSAEHTARERYKLEREAAGVSKKFKEALKACATETFRPVVNNGRYFNGEANYEEYLVSDKGHFKYLNYKNPKKCSIQMGYPAPTRKEMQFHLNAGDKKTCPGVHNIVADAFLGEFDHKLYIVEHKNGDWHDNSVENLVLVKRKGRTARKRAAEAAGEKIF